MVPIEYCKEKINYPSSDLYYSCIGLDEKQKNTSIALHALGKEILDIPYTVHEEAVARQKLAWWYEQINILYSEKKANHPVMKAILDLEILPELPKPLLDELVAGAMTTFSTHECQTEKEFFVHCYYYNGIVQLLQAHGEGFHGKDVVHFANHIGITLRTAALITTLRVQIAAGKLYFPKEHLENHQLTFDDFKTYEMNEKIKSFLGFEVNYAKDFYQRALKKLPRAQVHQQKSSIVLAHLAMRQLDEIAKDGFQVFNHEIHVTPIRKLFYRWKLLIGIMCRNRG